MPTYQPYSPDQAELLPAHVKDVLGPDHLCFVVHEVVEACDHSVFERPEEDAGGQRPYDPRMMLKIWLYGFGVNVRTTRKLEQRIREDLGFRYLAGGAEPDHKTLSEFHRRHREAIAEMFTEVLLFLRRAGMVRLGAVAIDSTRVKAQASPDRVVRPERLQRELPEKVERVGSGNWMTIRIAIRACEWGENSWRRCASSCSFCARTAARARCR
jgi:transposase